MILVLGGTADAREVALALRADGQPVLLTAVSDYAGQLAGDLPVRTGALDADSLGELLATAYAVIDATHPFATQISCLAMEACRAREVPFLRYEREDSRLPPTVFCADDAGQAAEFAVREARGGAIMLTVGSKTLATYLAVARAAHCRIIARVLPTAAVLAECERLGLAPCDIIAMQGPTSAELDAALIRHFGIRALVTKESGTVGGVMEKARAAEMTGIPLIVVRRPPIDYPRITHTIAGVLAYLAEVTHA